MSTSSCLRFVADRSPGDELVLLLFAGLDEPRACVVPARDRVLRFMREGDLPAARLRSEEAQQRLHRLPPVTLPLVLRADEEAADPVASVRIVHPPHREPDNLIVQVEPQGPPHPAVVAEVEVVCHARHVPPLLLPRLCAHHVAPVLCAYVAKLHLANPHSSSSRITADVTADRLLV